MNAIDQSFNRIPCHTDWQRYDSPTVCIFWPNLNTYSDSI
jgi:hypothetical protein